MKILLYTHYIKEGNEDLHNLILLPDMNLEILQK